MPVVRRALLSVSDKTGLVPLAEGLVACGVELLASGGTAALLRQVGVPVREVSDYTGAPEILEGRVKTLHPKIHGGILARRSLPSHQADLQREGIAPIDLVVVNLYPFAETIARDDVTLAEAVEKIDIGGPTLLRAAAKNFPDVLAVCDPADYDEVLAAVRAGQGRVPEALSARLARKVFAQIAHYDAVISNYLETQAEGAAAPADAKAAPGGADAQPAFPAVWTRQYTRVQVLRYGENPHQRAAWYQMVDEMPWIGAPLQGKELSYNNLLDIDAAGQLVRDLRAYPYAVAIIKHGNPCGVGVSANSLVEAFARAKAADPVAAFGGIVAMTTELDVATATAITESFFEVVCAPGFAAAALPIVASKKNLRVVPLRLDAHDDVVVRSCGGGRLVQTADAALEAAPQWHVVTKRVPTAEESRALQLAWIIGKHVRSNAIVFAHADASVGIGAGQMARVDAVRVAAMKAAGAPALAAASDAFFPFRDGVDAIAAVGVRAVIHPGGSVRDAEVIAAADELGMAMVVTGVRHFRH